MDERRRDTVANHPGKLKDRIDDELLCGVCHERLNQPKTLTQCSHSFCLVCLEKYYIHKKVRTHSVKGDQIDCPKCRAITVLPLGGITCLPTNHTLQNMADIISEEPDGENGETEPRCHQHRLVLNQYCTSCNELLCSECIHDPKHREHLQRGKIQLARNLLPKCLESLAKQLQPAKGSELHAKNLQEEVNKKQKAVTSNGEEAKEAVDAFCQEIAQKLEERKKVLLSAIEKNVNSKLATLAEQRRKLEVTTATTRSISDTVQRFCQSQSVQALAERKKIEDSLAEAQESLEKLENHLQDGTLDLLLWFQADQNFEQSIENLGTFTECAIDQDSTYLVMRHQLLINRDGNVFKSSLPTSTQGLPQAQYLSVLPATTEEDTYIYCDHPNLSQAASVPADLPSVVEHLPSLHLPPIPAFQADDSHVPRYSPQMGHKNLQASVSLGTTMVVASASPRAVRKVILDYETPLMYPPPHSPQRRRSSTPRVAAILTHELTEGVYEAPVMSPPPQSPQRRRSNTRPEMIPTLEFPEETVSKSTSEGVYDSLPCDKSEAHEEGAYLKPLLPPRNSSPTTMRKQRQRALTLPAQRTHLDVCEIDATMSYQRLQPELLKPVRVFTNDQLCDPQSKDKVFPCGVSSSSSFENIAFTDMLNHCVRVFREDGRLSLTIGSKGKANGQFDSPTSVLQLYNYLYVVDQKNGRVQKLSLQGKLHSMIGKKQLQSPWGIAISQLYGDIYISDSRQQCVFVYRSDCTFTRAIGGKHDKSIQFDHPAGMAFDTSGNLLVVDRGRVPCIWHISLPDGELLEKIGEGYLHEPCDVAVIRNGSIVVTERGRMNCISVFSSQGELIRCFGKTGSQPGEFRAPSGVATNSQGHIIVADQYNHRLQIFDLSERDGVEAT